MVFLCPKLFHSKVSTGILRQDSLSSYSFGKIQNVRGPEHSEEKNFFHKFYRKFKPSLFWKSHTGETSRVNLFFHLVISLFFTVQQIYQDTHTQVYIHIIYVLYIQRGRQVWFSYYLFEFIVEAIYLDCN